MAFVSEVTAKLNIDKTGAERDLTSVVASFGKAGEAIDKQFSKGFGFKKLAKSLLGGIGFAGAGDLKELIAKPFSDAADSAKRIEESTAETARIYERIFSSRRTDEQNLTANQRQQARLQKELAEVSQPKFETVPGIFNPFTGKTGDVQRLVKPANPERAAEIQKELAGLTEEELKLKDSIKKKEEKTADDRKKAIDDYSKKQEQLAQKEDEFARSQMTLEKQLADIQRERADVAERFAASNFRNLELADRELELKKEQARVEKAIENERKRKADKAQAIARQLVTAGQGVEKSRADYQTQLADRSGFTLAEVAAGKTTQSEKAKARQVMSLEARARRVRSMTDFRDPSGKLVSGEEYANRLMSRADQIRKGIGSLTSKEKDPMADAAEAIKKSEEHLASIDTKLTPEEIE